jgi:hypothetical protein
MTFIKQENGNLNKKHFRSFMKRHQKKTKISPEEIFALQIQDKHMIPQNQHTRVYPNNRFTILGILMSFQQVKSSKL